MMMRPIEILAGGSNISVFSLKILDELFMSLLTRLISIIFFCSYLFDEKEERWEIATLNRFIPLLNPMQLSKEEWNRAIDVQWGLAEPEDASGSGSGETISGSP